MTSPALHDTPLIPWEQEAAFIDGVATDESHELGVDELLARAYGQRRRGGRAASPDRQ